MFQRVRPWLWLFALACGATGVYGLADLATAEPAGQLLLVGPHAVGVALAACGRQRVGAGLVVVVGSAAMACLSWADALGRQTEGLEWRFNNALSGAMCCGANWLVLVVVCVVLVLSAPTEAPVTPLGARSGGGERVEPGAAPDTTMRSGWHRGAGRRGAGEL